MAKKKKKENSCRILGAYLPSGDRVKVNMANAGATADQIDTVLWSLNWARANKITSISTLARRMNVCSPPTLSRVFAGKYGAGLANICSDIDHFRKIANERQQMGEEPLVSDLRVVQDIAEFCELTRVSATMSILFGPNQSGKSWTLEKIYTPANNHGRTIYVRMPVGGGTRLFLERLMSACGISERKAYSEMVTRAVRYFDPQTLLIIDEIHQAMIGRFLKAVTLERIREIHDLSGCGVVLCGTDIVPEMINDPKYKKFLGQIGNRGVLRRMIPAKPYDEDVAALCRAYGFSKPDGEARALVKQISSTNGIGKLCKFFRMSVRLANNQRTPVSWDHFLQTHATLKGWERGDDMKR